MTEVVLYHHAQGLTEGVRSFADQLRAAGHVVHVPDLYEGNTYDNLEEGIAYAKQVGFGMILGRESATVTTLGIFGVFAIFWGGVLGAGIATAMAGEGRTA